MSRDVVASIRFYEQLGFVRAFGGPPENARYAGVRRDGVELHLQWHDAAEWEYPNDRPTYCFVVADVDGLYREFRDAGIGENINSLPRQVGALESFTFEIQTGTGYSSIGFCSLGTALKWPRAG
jgi:hypothetical protein